MNQYGSVNPELLGMARQTLARHAQLEKQGFIPQGDPTMGGGDPSQGGAPPGAPPPGGDPSQGGAPPPDPSQGGAPPSDPTQGMQGGGMDIGSMIQQQVQMALQGMTPGGGAGGAGAGIKPKIDENVVMLQILKLLAKICDGLGIKVSASEMVVTPQDLQAMAQGGPGMAAVQDQSQNGGQAGTQPSAIQPIQPMGAAAPGMGGGAKQGSDRYGVAFDTGGFAQIRNKAAAIQARRNAAVRAL
jgi:hypothetical protein